MHHHGLLAACAIVAACASTGMPTPWSRPASDATRTQARPSSASRTVELGVGDDIQAAIGRHASDTVFRLRAGTYRLAAPLRPKDGQAFVSDEGAILSGARVLTSFRRSGPYWVAIDQRQEGRVVERAAEVCRTDAPRCTRPEDLFLDHRVLRHVDHPAQLVPGAWHFDYPGDRILMADDPAGHQVETSVTPFAVHGEAERVTLRGLVVERFATPTHEAAVSGRLLGLTAEGLELRDNHFAGLETVSRALARGNHAHHNGALGLIGSGEDVLIENNEIDHNNTVGYNPAWAAGGTKWVYTTRLTVRGNHAHHNGGPGLWTDINNIDVLFEHNRAHDNDLSGIFHEVGYRAVIRRNVASRNGRARPSPGWVDGAGILVSSSSDVEVYENQLADNWQGITGLETHRRGGIHGPWQLTRLYVHDNVIRQSEPLPAGAGRSGIAQVGDDARAFATRQIRFWRNTYYLAGLRRSFFWLGLELGDQEWAARGLDVDGRVIRTGGGPSSSR